MVQLLATKFVEFDVYMSVWMRLKRNKHRSTNQTHVVQDVPAHETPSRRTK